MDIAKSLSEIRTPKKIPKHVLLPSYKAGAFDSHAVDCPFLFFHDNRFWMTYVGWDGVGYQTGWATSAGEILVEVGPDGSIDSQYAHKPGMISLGNRLYHFYCAVAPATQRELGEITHKEVRGIAATTN